MNRFLKISFLSFLFISILLVSASYADTFEVFSRNPKLKQKIEEAVNTSYAKLKDFFGDSLSKPAEIFITQNDQEFDSLVGDNFPDWGIAAAIPERNLIILKSPAKYGYLQDLPKVITHELAHIYLGNRVNRQDLPRWLDEGFAMYIAEEWRWSLDLSIAKAVFTSSTLNLTEIDSVNFFGTPKAHLAYLESFLAINYFVQQYGQDNLKELIRHLAQGEDVDSALLETIGLNSPQFSDKFVQNLKQKYNWTNFLDDTLFLWLALAFLVVVFYFMKKSRSNKIMQSWEEEEENWPKEK